MSTLAKFHWRNSYWRSSVLPRYRRLFGELGRLERMESENKFILHSNPLARSGNREVPPRFNNTTVPEQFNAEGVITFQGRIFPQSEPYCRALFLIEIKIPPEYPFRVPTITFVDPIYHVEVQESGRHCCCESFGYGDESHKPTTHLTEIIESVIRVTDSAPRCFKVVNPERAHEHETNYQTFYKKALECTLSYGRPRYLPFEEKQ